MEVSEVSLPTVIDVFPNGNAVITPEVDMYVTRYKTFARKTAESIIGLATTLIEAEEELHKEDFIVFCDEVGIKMGDSTYSKLRKIGASASRFKPYIESLPNTWTTLYALAKLDPSAFQQIAADLNPFMTAKDVQQALGASKQSTSVRDTVDLTISFGAIDVAKKREVYRFIVELEREFNFSVKVNPSLAKEMREEIIGEEK